LTSENDVFRGSLNPSQHEIIDCGAFYEATFFCISPKNLFGDFFYSLNAELTGAQLFARPVERLVRRVVCFAIWISDSRALFTAS